MAIIHIEEEIMEIVIRIKEVHYHGINRNLGKFVDQERKWEHQLDQLKIFSRV